MRKVYKNRNEEAVSPVIATILMVAITVVLAAVLYVMVMGMADTDTSNTPTATWQNCEKVDADTAKLTYGTFGTDTAPKDVSVIITAPNGDTMTIYVEGDITTGDTNVTMEGTTGTALAYYFDLNPAGNTLGGGDYIMIHGLDQVGVYEVQMFHIPSDATITGGSNDFQL